MERNKVLVTGANGFIGSHLCQDLLGRGFEVFGLVRPTSDLHFLKGLPVNLVSGDLRWPERISLPADIRYVIHSASVVSDQAGDDQCREQIYRLAVNLIDRLAALGCRPRRIVYISTALTLGYGRLDISEDRPGRSARFLPYTRAKILTEAFMRSQFASHGLPVVILRPSDVFGPRDRTACREMLYYLEKGVPMIVGHGNWHFGFCYIANLCQAVHRALITPGIEGRSYTVTNGQLVTWRMFFGEIYKRLDRRQRIFLPGWLVMSFARLQKAYHALNPRFTPYLTTYRIRRVTSHTTYDISRTVRELDYRPDQDFRRQVHSIVEWYLQEKRDGYIG